MKKVLIPGIVAGITMLVIGSIYSMALSALVPSILAEYKNTAVFRPWADPLMQAFLAYPIILGLALAWVWDKVKGLLSGNIWQKALTLALTYLIVATIPGMFASYTCFQISLAMTLNWAVGGFIYVFVGGAVLAKLNG